MISPMSGYCNNDSSVSRRADTGPRLSLKSRHKRQIYIQRRRDDHARCCEYTVRTCLVSFHILLQPALSKHRPSRFPAVFTVTYPQHAPPPHHSRHCHCREVRHFQRTMSCQCYYAVSMRLNATKPYRSFWRP